MIEYHIFKELEKHASKGKHLICLGDQIPAYGLGFPSISNLAENLDISIQTLDYDGHADILHDLNYPIPPYLRDSADIIFDGGTLEHVANIGQAWQNISDMLKVGGIIIHCNPMNCYGDSYYGLDPMVFNDVYTNNGFETLSNQIYYRTGWRLHIHKIVLKYFPKSLKDRIQNYFKNSKPETKTFLLKDKPSNIHFVDAYTTKQWKFLPTLSHVFYVGKKLKNTSPWIWPAQSSYPKVS